MRERSGFIQLSRYGPDLDPDRVLGLVSSSGPLP